MFHVIDGKISGVFQKGWLSKRVVLAPMTQPERGYIRMFPPGTKNQNEGTFAGTTLCKTAFLLPLEINSLRIILCHGRPHPLHRKSRLSKCNF